MTTGNSAAMTMSVAGAKAAFIKTDCEELHKKNVDQREKVGQSVQRELDKGAANPRETEEAQQAAQAGARRWHDVLVGRGEPAHRRRKGDRGHRQWGE